MPSTHSPRQLGRTSTGASTAAAAGGAHKQKEGKDSKDYQAAWAALRQRYKWALEGQKECAELLGRAEGKQRKLQREIDLVLDAIAERRARRYALLARMRGVGRDEVAREEARALQQFCDAIGAPGLQAGLSPEARQAARQRWRRGRGWAHAQPQAQPRPVREGEGEDEGGMQAAAEMPHREQTLPDSGRGRPADPHHTSPRTSPSRSRSRSRSPSRSRTSFSPGV